MPPLKEEPMQLRTYKYRLYPTMAQKKAMFQTLSVCRHWYNMALEDRKLTWEFEQRSITEFDQVKQIVFYRKAFPKAGMVSSRVLRSVCRDLDKAFKAFFRRVKAGEKPGYPRFKSTLRFNSFNFPVYGNGIKIDRRRLRLFGIGRVAVRWHRPIEGKIKQARIVHRAGRWYACFACELPDPTPLSATGERIGIDMGITALMTDNHGRKIENPRWYRKSEAKLRVAQRALQRKVKGSKNRKKALRRVQRIHEKISNTRHDFLNKIIYGLVQNFDLVALEDLKIDRMTHNPRLSKSILDAGWGYFKEHLVGKAVSAGREVIFVNPAYTSKTCSKCGSLFEDLKLSDRWVTCECGLSLDRDHNAAINILNRAG